MVRITIIGGSGMIGSKLAPKLREKGHEVWVGVNIVGSYSGFQLGKHCLTLTWSECRNRRGSCWCSEGDWYCTSSFFPLSFISIFIFIFSFSQFFHSLFLIGYRCFRFSSVRAKGYFRTLREVGQQFSYRREESRRKASLSSIYCWCGLGTM